MGALTACLVLALATAMSGWVAALIVAAGYGVIAGGLALMGKTLFSPLTAPEACPLIRPSDVLGANTGIPALNLWREHVDTCCSREAEPLFVIGNHGQVRELGPFEWTDWQLEQQRFDARLIGPALSSRLRPSDKEHHDEHHDSAGGTDRGPSVEHAGEGADWDPRSR